MVTTEKEQLFYIGWVDRRTDPWPNHERLRPGADQQLEGRPVEFLPTDHPKWPGLPCVRSVEPATSADGRMGRYAWPGIPLADRTRVYAGPTVAALLHPRSVARLKGLKRAYLLYQPDAPDSPHDRLGEILIAAARARGVADARKRVELCAVPGIADPTDFRQIIEAVKRWLRERDPLGLKERCTPPPRRVYVNLSPGTTAMAASWLILYWSGALGGTRATVDFVQGDGGLDSADTPDNPAHQPLREVPVDVLALVKAPDADLPSPPAEDTVPGEAVRRQPEVRAEKLTGPPYDTVRQELERAALVGEPVVLVGERGTGKTFLAEFFHERRAVYRWGPDGRPPAAPDADIAKGKGRRPAAGPPWRGGTRKLVKVSLSEYADLNTLKFSLFGWMRKSFSGAGDEDYDGLLGEAHEGTLFLDEIHHLPREIQRLLLSPLNFDAAAARTYAPAFGYYQVASDFSLITATNDPRWREKLLPDLHDRVARITVRVPPLRDYKSQNPQALWNCWTATLDALCSARRIENPPADESRKACDQLIDEFLSTDPLPGNWRDLQSLAAYVLYFMTDARSGRALPRLDWSQEQTSRALEAAAANRPVQPAEAQR